MIELEDESPEPRERLMSLAVGMAMITFLAYKVNSYVGNAADSPPLEQMGSSYETVKAYVGKAADSTPLGQMGKSYETIKAYVGKAVDSTPLGRMGSNLEIFKDYVSKATDSVHLRQMLNADSRMTEWAEKYSREYAGLQSLYRIHNIDKSRSTRVFFDPNEV